MKNTKLNGLNVFDTSYEDGTKWVEFEFEDGMISYELIGQDSAIPVGNIENKLELKDMSPIFSKLLVRARENESDMVFVEVGEISKRNLQLIKDDVERNSLYEYVEFGDEPLVTIFGGIITKFIYRPVEIYNY